MAGVAEILKSRLVCNSLQELQIHCSLCKADHLEQIMATQ